MVADGARERGRASRGWDGVAMNQTRARVRARVTTRVRACVIPGLLLGTFGGAAS